MTGLGTLGLLLAFAASVLLFAGAGELFFNALRWKPAHAADRLLFSIAAGVTLLELAVTAGQLAPTLPTGVRIACIAVAIAGLAGLRFAFADLRECLRVCSALSGAPRILAAALLLVLALEMLASLAPLTGSDALHYHFAAQQIFLADGFHAPWPLLHGFFCGLGHQLILAALTLRSGRLAQLWLFLGGAVAAFATLRVAQLFSANLKANAGAAAKADVWPWFAAIAFTLTPVSVWQISTAGAPDIWLCALLPLTLRLLLEIFRAGREVALVPVLVAGFLAGAVAGTKYTGIFLAAVLLAGFALAARSAGRTALFFAAAVVTGIWPYLRNWLWTGDPLFPFLLARSHAPHPATFNATAVSAILADTGATHGMSLWELAKFPLMAAVDYQHLGAWQLLGPLVLAFAPVALPQLRKTGEGRIALLVWILGALAIGASSGMARFLLPLLPVALAASIGAAAGATRGRWRVLRALLLVSLAGFCAAGFAAMAAYSHRAWSVALGRTSPDAYLSANAPDYQRSQFVNRELASQRDGRVLIFFRHLYYLRVPYFNGDPQDSWPMNPQLLNAAGQGSEAWRELFRNHGIRWVLKSPKYPRELAAALENLEQQGVLAPCASGEVAEFSGNRIEGQRVREPITLLCVR
jgi:hypothetical protein